jgi:hypothetical protein
MPLLSVGCRWCSRASSYRYREPIEGDTVRPTLGQQGVECVDLVIRRGPAACRPASSPISKRLVRSGLRDPLAVRDQPVHRQVGEHVVGSSRESLVPDSPAVLGEWTKHSFCPQLVVETGARHVSDPTIDSRQTPVARRTEHPYGWRHGPRPSSLVLTRSRGHRVHQPISGRNGAAGRPLVLVWHQ